MPCCESKCHCRCIDGGHQCLAAGGSQRGELQHRSPQKVAQQHRTGKRCGIKRHHCLRGCNLEALESSARGQEAPCPTERQTQLQSLWIAAPSACHTSAAAEHLPACSGRRTAAKCLLHVFFSRCLLILLPAQGAPLHDAIGSRHTAAQPGAPHQHLPRNPGAHGRGAHRQRNLLFAVCAASHLHTRGAPSPALAHLEEHLAAASSRGSKQGEDRVRQAEGVLLRPCRCGLDRWGPLRRWRPVVHPREGHRDGRRAGAGRVGSGPAGDLCPKQGQGRRLQTFA
mmetsp:Transcript_66093/g.186765  ORF Transcript_66093/g.186765 Transcript_66093/m.186765 type:complete len:283 (-) Transcript_66093:240-1088(-)